MKSKTRIVTGVKKSWARARELHQKTRCDSSMPSLARSYLAGLPSDVLIDKNTIQGYEEYLLKYWNTRDHLEYEEAAINTQSKVTTTAAQADDVSILFDIKDFLTSHNLSIKDMQKLLHFIEIIQA